MTFPIKKRINTELFIDMTVALWFEQEYGQYGQPLVIAYLQNQVYLMQKMRDWGTFRQSALKWL